MKLYSRTLSLPLTLTNQMLTLNLTRSLEVTSCCMETSENVPTRLAVLIRSILVQEMILIRRQICDYKHHTHREFEKGAKFYP